MKKGNADREPSPSEELGQLMAKLYEVSPEEAMRMTREQKIGRLSALQNVIAAEFVRLARKAIMNAERFPGECKGLSDEVLCILLVNASRKVAEIVAQQRDPLPVMPAAGKVEGPRRGGRNGSPEG